MRQVIVLDKGVAEAISDILHRIEANGFNLTEFEAEMWGQLTAAILKPAELNP